MSTPQPRSMRPRTLGNELGDVMTLDDVAEFVAEMSALGMPGTCEIRVTCAMEVNFKHGPRIVKITALPPVAEEQP